MSTLKVQLNASWTVTTNNGTAYSLVMTSGGALSAPGTISSVGAITSGGTISFTVGGFKGIHTHANTTDRTYTFKDRNGNVALEDWTSLTAMVAATIGANTGKAIGTSDGVNLSWLSIGGSSLVTLNGISTSTYNAQTFAVPGTTGTAPNWVSTGSNTNTHTLHIPMASATGVTAGLMTKTDYDRIGFKDATNTWSAAQTFSNAPTITTPGTLAAQAACLQDVWNARNGIGIRPPVDGIDTTNYTTGLPVTAAIGGVTATVGMRFLFTNLTGSMAGYNNKVFKVASIGPVTWIGGTSTPTAELDGQAGTGAPTDGDIVFVRSGTNADQQWAYNGSAWVQYSSNAAWVFSTGLTVTGNTVTVTYGSTGTTACVGNDSRLSDSRTPLAHVLDSASHTVSGKTAGQILLATGATTFGFVGATGDWSISGAGATLVNSIQGTSVGNLGLVLNTATLADNTSSPTVVTGATFAGATYRNMKIEFSISRGAGNYAAGYINILFDGTNAQITQVFDIEFGTTGITFTAVNNSGTIQLMYTTTSSAGQAATMRFATQLFPV